MPPLGGRPAETRRYRVPERTGTAKTELAVEPVEGDADVEVTQPGAVATVPQRVGRQAVDEVGTAHDLHLDAPPPLGSGLVVALDRLSAKLDPAGQPAPVCKEAFDQIPAIGDVRPATGTPPVQAGVVEQKRSAAPHGRSGRRRAGRTPRRSGRREGRAAPSARPPLRRPGRVGAPTRRLRSLWCRRDRQAGPPSRRHRGRRSARNGASLQGTWPVSFLVAGRRLRRRYRDR